MRKTALTAFALAASLLLAACGSNGKEAPTKAPGATNGASTTPASSPGATKAPGATQAPGTPTGTATPKPTNNASGGKDGAVTVVAEPESITVLVNKQSSLPKGYAPTDLVYPNVPFTFKEKIEKRMMRKEAAAALEQLFEGAKKDGISLAGVSAYRSNATQRSLFNSYVQRDGEEKARKYSAYPGQSEHETGLAIDVSGSDGKCAAQDCFGGTKEAVWLEKHVAEYGFIIRYPKGKDAITGYQYEPWHLRYVGVQWAKEMYAKGETLEEYMNAVPVNK